MKARLLQLRQVRGGDGVLTIGESLPFSPSRWFTIREVPAGVTRGSHAHRVCEQLMIALAGRCTVTADDGRHRRQFVLDGDGQALHVPPLVWTAQHDWSPDACLLVLASHPYDADDYLRDLDELKRLLGP
jgi:dTDP-4-dehydrorhamnose 3,5-epimerase-like enzyme